jgi:hypothetical protein
MVPGFLHAGRNVVPIVPGATGYSSICYTFDRNSQPMQSDATGKDGKLQSGTAS